MDAMYFISRIDNSNRSFLTTIFWCNVCTVPDPGSFLAPFALLKASVSNTSLSNSACDTKRRNITTSKLDCLSMPCLQFQGDKHTPSTNKLTLVQWFHPRSDAKLCFPEALTLCRFLPRCNLWVSFCFQPFRTHQAWETHHWQCKEANLMWQLIQQRSALVLVNNRTAQQRARIMKIVRCRMNSSDIFALMRETNLWVLWKSDSTFKKHNKPKNWPADSEAHSLHQRFRLHFSQRTIPLSLQLWLCDI